MPYTGVASDLPTPLPPSSTPQADVQELQNRIARLSLICEALWEIVKEKQALPADLLNLKVAEIDMSDGRLNGRKASTLVSCPQCKRPMSPGHQSCLYCGAFVSEASVFNGFA